MALYGTFSPSFAFNGYRGWGCRGSTCILTKHFGFRSKGKFVSLLIRTCIDFKCKHSFCFDAKYDRCFCFTNILAVCKDDCNSAKSQGFCAAPGTCVCREGFKGDYCESGLKPSKLETKTCIIRIRSKWISLFKS